jgi:phosphoribosylformylglycinamidine synthase
MFIGGFSYGDHMGSGHVLAMRIRHRLQEHLNQFIANGNIVLGVCNGFQVMTKIGLLPGLDQKYDNPQVALLQNDCGTFQDRWIRIGFDQSSPCIFTKGLEPMDMPIRHGEGKFFTPNRNLLKRLEQENLAVCRYVQPETGEPAKRAPWNPNGSLNAIAGICDPTGRVFGMMPHPEAFLFEENHPDWTEKPGERSGKQTGLQIFHNAVEYLN